MRETKIENRLRVKIEKLGGKAIKLVSPGNNGVPDRLVILPNGRTLYVETKAPGKPLKPLQGKWFKTLNGLGHSVFKIDSQKDVDRFVAMVIADEI